MEAFDYDHFRLECVDSRVQGIYSTVDHQKCTIEKSQKGLIEPIQLKRNHFIKILLIVRRIDRWYIDINRHFNSIDSFSIHSMILIHSIYF